MRDHRYRVTAHRPPHLLVTDHPEYGTTVWAGCRITKRRAGELCALCGLRVGLRGARPVDNGGNRMRRICASHLEGESAAAEGKGAK